MANPYPAKFRSTCEECGTRVEEGEKMFAHDGQFICEHCADLGGMICDCGNYKKPQYDECWECH